MSRRSVEVGDLQRALDGGLAVRARHAVEVREHEQVLLDRERDVEVVELGHDAAEGARRLRLLRDLGGPRTSISPSSGIACAVSSFIVVDLPAPFGPSRPTQVPSGTSRSRWSTAVSVPKRLTTPCRRRAGTPPRVSRGYAQFGTGSRPNEGLEERQVRVQRLGVPLDADDEAGALDRLDRAVRRRGRRPAARRRSGRPPGGGRSSRASVRVRKIRCRRERAAICTSCVACVAGSVWRWPGMCWCSVPPQATLSAWAPRQMARIGRSRDERLAGEARARTRRGSARSGPSSSVAVGGAVGRRVEIGAAGQADAVEAVEQRREVIGADRREHDGDRAGRRPASAGRSSRAPSRGARARRAGASSPSRWGEAPKSSRRSKAAYCNDRQRAGLIHPPKVQDIRRRRFARRSPFYAARRDVESIHLHDVQTEPGPSAG